MVKNQIGVFVVDSIRGTALSFALNGKHVNLLAFASEVFFNSVDSSNSSSLSAKKGFESFCLSIVVNQIQFSLRFSMRTFRVSAFFEIGFLSD